MEEFAFRVQSAVGSCFPAALLSVKEDEAMSLIRVQDLTFAYEGSYDNIFEHVSVRLDTDWRLGLTGRDRKSVV